MNILGEHWYIDRELPALALFFHTPDIAAFHLYAFDYVEIKQRVKKGLRDAHAKKYVAWNISRKDRVGIKNYLMAANK